MVRKRVLSPLISVAGLLAVIGFAYFVVPFFFVIPCCPEDLHAGSSPAPSPGGGGECDDMVCLRAPFAVVLALVSVVSFTVGFASSLLKERLAGDEEEDEASGAANKAGYVAIADDDGLEAGTCADGKN